MKKSKKKKESLQKVKNLPENREDLRHKIDKFCSMTEFILLRMSLLAWVIYEIASYIAEKAHIHT